MVRRTIVGAIFLLIFLSPYRWLQDDAEAEAPVQIRPTAIKDEPRIDDPKPGINTRMPLGPQSVSGFNPGAGDSASPLTAYLPLAMAMFVLLAAFALSRTRRILHSLPAAEAVVEDTTEFKSALEIWQPWILFKKSTPRSAKSFKNRVRYLAGVQRVAPSTRNIIERMLASASGWLGRSGVSNEIGPPIPEPLLVALAAIYHCDPRWLDDASGWKLIEMEMVEDLLRPAAAGGAVAPVPGAGAAADDALADSARQLESAIQEFRKFFPSAWPPSRAQREQFLLLAAGVRIQGSVSQGGDSSPATQA